MDLTLQVSLIYHNSTHGITSRCPDLRGVATRVPCYREAICFCMCAGFMKVATSCPTLQFFNSETHHADKSVWTPILALTSGTQFFGGSRCSGALRNRSGGGQITCQSSYRLSDSHNTSGGSYLDPTIGVMVITTREFNRS